MSRHGQKLGPPDAQGIMVCPESGQRYREEFPGTLQSLDLDEELPLPSELSKGTKPYREFRRSTSTPTSASTSRRPPRTRKTRDKKTKEEAT